MFTPNFDFMKYQRPALIISALITVVALGSLIFKGLNLGIEFTGGVNVEVRYDQPADIQAIREQLAAGEFEAPIVQSVGAGTDVLIRLPPGANGSDEAGARDEVLRILRQGDPNVEILDSSVVFPQIGEELTEQGGLALMFALIMVFIYVMLRFRWKLAVGAIVATLHDVIVTIGVFSLFELPFDLTVLGSILAVLGYSLNDTIVVYDRIRDNFRLMRRGTAEAIVNTSVNQTLARTIVTGLTTLLVLVALLLLAGSTLWGFSFALIVGILVGTYSSIYVASSMALVLNVMPADLMPAKQEQIDELP
jgi:preprotein translocase subunit SecF